MESQVCTPHPEGCFLAKVEQIYGPARVKQLHIMEVCGITCRVADPAVVMLAVLSQIAPRSHGWYRWNIYLPRCYSYVDLARWSTGSRERRKLLIKLISIAPRPKSYKKWNALLDLIGEETGGVGECVRCQEQTPLADMIHRGSDQGMSHFAGLVCKHCNNLINSGQVRR